MKSFTFCLLMLVVGATSATSPGVAMSNKVKQGTPVDISIKCGGLDLETLDPVSAIVVGRVLEESYSQVISKDSPDSFMKVDRPWRRQGWRPSWRCGSLCPDDDAVVESTNLNTRDGFVVEGYLSGGDVNGVEGHLKGTGMSSWEKAFVYALIETRRNTFRTIEECSITVEPSTNIDQ